ncbi:MAG: dockerin type I domain-containing protein, partial [Candidatus Omnitrophica bacterium]|nr:dockerin type I domain-containing protein [Candidatus Omnitrophota bacterium]
GLEDILYLYWNSNLTGDVDGSGKPVITAADVELLEDALKVAAMADLDYNNKLDFNDIIRIYDIFESKQIEKDLGFTDLKSYLAAHPDYDVDKSGYVDDADLAAITYAINNYSSYDIAGAPTQDVNGDGVINNKDVRIAPDGKVDQHDIDLMNIAIDYGYMKHSITDADILAANINGDVDSQGRPILSEADYELIASLFIYAKDVNGDGEYKYLADSADQSLLLQIVHEGGMAALDVQAEGLQRLDLNKDGVITAADLIVAQGGFDERDVLAVEAAYKLINEYGYTLEDIRKSDLDFSGSINEADTLKMQALTKNDLDLDGDGDIDLDDVARIRELATILLSGAVMPRAYIINSDINGDGVINEADMLLLQKAMDYHIDVNKDGSVDYTDLAVVTNAFHAAGYKLSPEDIMAADLNQDFWIDEKDLAIMKDIVQKLPQYDLNMDQEVNMLDLMVLYNVLGTSPEEMAATYRKVAEDTLELIKLAKTKAEALSLYESAVDAEKRAKELYDNVVIMTGFMQNEGQRPQKMVADVLSQLEGLRAVNQTIRDTIISIQDPVMTTLDRMNEKKAIVNSIKSSMSKAYSVVQADLFISKAEEARREAEALLETLIGDERAAGQTVINDIIAAIAEIKDAHSNISAVEAQATNNYNRITQGIESISYYLDLAKEASDYATIATLVGLAEEESLSLQEAYWALDTISDSHAGNDNIKAQKSKALSAISTLSALITAMRKEMLKRDMLSGNGENTIEDVDDSMRALEALMAQTATIKAIRAYREFVLNIYTAALGRQPLAEELRVNIGKLFGSDTRGPMSRLELAKELLLSDEFQLLDINERQFISRVFQAFNMRAPSSIEINHFLERMAGEGITTRPGIVGLFASMTDGTKVDSDSDGFSDKEEILAHKDPRDALSTPAAVTEEDTDGDGLSNADEAINGTNANDVDSDNDGFSDAYEVNVLGSDPLIKDSGVEITTEDQDGDGIKDIDESMLPEGGMDILYDNLKAFDDISISAVSYVEIFLNMDDTLLLGDVTAVENSMLDAIRATAYSIMTDLTRERSMLEADKYLYVTQDKLVRAMNAVKAEMDKADATYSQVIDLTGEGATPANNYSFFEDRVGSLSKISKANKILAQNLKDTYEIGLGSVASVTALETLSAMGATLSTLAGDAYRSIDIMHDADPQNTSIADARVISDQLYRDTLTDLELIRTEAVHSTTYLSMGANSRKEAEALLNIITMTRTNVLQAETSEKAEALKGTILSLQGKLNAMKAAFENSVLRITGEQQAASVRSARAVVSGVITQTAAIMFELEAQIKDMAYDENRTKLLAEETYLRKDSIENNIASARSASNSASQKAMLVNIEQAMNELESNVAEIGTLLLKWPYNAIVKAEAQVADTDTIELRIKIDELKEDIAVTEAVDTQGESVKKDADSALSLASDLGEFAVSLQDEGTLSALKSLVEELLARVREDKDVINKAVIRSGTPALEMSSEYVTNKLAAIQGIADAITKLADEKGASMTSGANLAGKNEELAEAIKFMYQESILSDNAGSAAALLDFSETIVAEADRVAAECARLADAVSDTDGQKAVWLDNKKLTQDKADEIRAFRENIQKRASFLRVREIDTMLSEYKTIAKGLQLEADTANVTDAKSLALLARALAARGAELKEEALASLKTAGAADSVTELSSKISATETDLYNIANAAEKIALRIEAFDTDLQSLVTKVEEIADMADEVKALANTTSVMSRAGFVRLTSLQKMIEEAEADFNTAWNVARDIIDNWYEGDRAHDAEFTFDTIMSYSSYISSAKDRIYSLINTAKWNSVYADEHFAETEPTYAELGTDYKAIVVQKAASVAGATGVTAAARDYNIVKLAEETSADMLRVIAEAERAGENLTAARESVRASLEEGKAAEKPAWNKLVELKGASYAGETALEEAKSVEKLALLSAKTDKFGLQETLIIISESLKADMDAIKTIGTNKGFANIALLTAYANDAAQDISGALSAIKDISSSNIMGTSDLAKLESVQAVLKILNDGMGRSSTTLKAKGLILLMDPVGNITGEIARTIEENVHNNNTIFAGWQSLTAVETAKENEKISRETKIISRDSLSLLDKADTLSDQVLAYKTLAAAALSDLNTAASAAQAKSMIYVAEMSYSKADEAISGIRRSKVLLPNDASVAATLDSAEAILKGLAEYKVRAAKMFAADSDWTYAVTLNAEGSGISQGTEGDLTRLTITQGPKTITIYMKNRSVVSVKEEAAGQAAVITDADLGNTSFSLASDGSVVWKVTRRDGSVIVINDYYTGQATIEPAPGGIVPEWIQKISDFVEGKTAINGFTVDFSALSAATSEATKQFRLSLIIIDAVTAFFTAVINAYAASLKETLTAAEKADVAYYMPFIKSLLSANPAILICDTLSAVTSWIAAQGSNIINCAVEALSGYLKAMGKEMATEKVALQSMITGILTGQVSATSAGVLEHSFFSLKTLAKSQGITLNGIRADFGTLESRSFPVMALLQENGEDHIVLIKSISDGKVTYVSDGIEKEPEDAIAFAKRYQGYILTEEAPTPQDEVMSDAELIDAKGSLVNDLESRMTTFIDSLNSQTDEMTTIKDLINDSVTAADAEISKNIAGTLKETIETEAEYIAQEAANAPDNVTLQAFNAQAQAILTRAKDIYDGINSLYTKIYNAESQSKYDLDRAEDNHNILESLLLNARQNPDNAPVILSIAQKAYDAIVQGKANVTANRASYPSNVNIEDYSELINATEASAKEKLDEIDEISKDVIKSKVLSEEQVARADVNKDGKVDDEDKKLLQKAVDFGEITGDSKITSADLARWGDLLDLMDMQYVKLDRAMVSRADVNNDGKIDSADADLLGDLIASHKDVNRDGVVNAQDVIAVNDVILQRTMNPLEYGPEYDRVEYSYNPEKGENQARVYEECAKVAAEAARQTLNASAADIFAYIAEQMATNAETAAQDLEASEGSNPDPVVQNNIELAKAAAKNARALAKQARESSDILNQTNAVEKMRSARSDIETSINAFITKVDTKISDLNAELAATTDPQRISEINNEIAALQQKKTKANEILADITALDATMQNVSPKFDAHYAEKVLAYDQAISSIISFMQKGENAVAGKALWQALADTGIISNTPTYEAGARGLADDLESLSLDLKAASDNYLDEVLLDSTARLARQAYNEAKAAAEAEYKRITDIIKQNATTARDAATGAASSACNIGEDLTTMTAAELEAALERAWTNRDTVNAKKYEIMKLLGLMDEETADTVQAAYNITDKSLKDVDDTISALTSRLAAVKANDVAADALELQKSVQAATDAVVAIMNSMLTLDTSTMQPADILSTYRTALTTLTQKRREVLALIDEMHYRYSIASDEALPKLSTQLQNMNYMYQVIISSSIILNQRIMIVETQVPALGAAITRAGTVYSTASAISPDTSSLSSMQSARGELLTAIDELTNLYNETLGIMGEGTPPPGDMNNNGILDRDEVRQMLDTIESKYSGVVTSVNDKVANNAKDYNDAIVIQAEAIQASVTSAYSDLASAAAVINGASVAAGRIALLKSTSHSSVGSTLSTMKGDIADISGTASQSTYTYAKNEGDTYYDTLSETYESLMVTADEKNQEYQSAYTEATQDDIFGNLSALGNMVEETAAKQRKLATRATTAMEEIAREYDFMKELYKESFREEQKFAQYVAIINKELDIANDVFINTNLQNAITDPAYFDTIAAQFDESAKAAQYSYDQIQAISLSNPTNKVFADKVKAISVKIADLKNCARLFEYAAKIVEGARNVDDIKEAIKVTTTFKTRIYTSIAAGVTSDQMEAYLDALTIAEEELHDSQNSILAAAQDGMDAVNDLETVADRVRLTMGTYGSVAQGEDSNGNGTLDTEDTNGNGTLDPGEDLNGNGKIDTEDRNGNGVLDKGISDIDAFINQLKTRAMDAMVQANGTLDIDILSPITAAEAQAKAAEMEAYYLGARQDMNSAWYEYMGEDTNGNGTLDTEDANGNNILDPGEDLNGNNILDTEDVNGNDILDLGVKDYWDKMQAYETSLYEYTTAFNKVYSVSPSDPSFAALCLEANKARQAVTAEAATLNRLAGEYNAAKTVVSTKWDTLTNKLKDLDETESGLVDLTAQVNAMTARVNKLATEKAALEAQAKAAKDNRDGLQDALNKVMILERQARKAADEVSYAQTMAPYSSYAFNSSDAEWLQKFWNLYNNPSFQNLRGQEEAAAFSQIANDLYRIADEALDEGRRLQAIVNTATSEYNSAAGALASQESYLDQAKGDLVYLEDQLSAKQKDLTDKEIAVETARADFTTGLNDFEKKFTAYDAERTKAAGLEVKARELEAKTTIDSVKENLFVTMNQKKESRDKAEERYLELKAIADRTGDANDVAAANAAKAAFETKHLAWLTAKGNYDVYMNALKATIDPFEDNMTTAHNAFDVMSTDNDMAKVRWQSALSLMDDTRAKYRKARDEASELGADEANRANAVAIAESLDTIFASASQATKDALSVMRSAASFVDERAAVIDQKSGTISGMADFNELVDRIAQVYPEQRAGMQEVKFYQDSAQAGIAEEANKREAYLTKLNLKNQKEQAMIEASATLTAAYGDWKEAVVLYGANADKTLAFWNIFDTLKTLYNGKKTEYLNAEAAVNVAKDAWLAARTALWETTTQTVAGAITNVPGDNALLREKMALFLASFTPDYSATKANSYYKTIIGPGTTTDEIYYLSADSEWVKARTKERQYLWQLALREKDDYEKAKELVSMAEFVVLDINNKTEQTLLSAEQLRSEIEGLQNEKTDLLNGIMTLLGKKHSVEKSLANPAISNIVTVRNQLTIELAAINKDYDDAVKQYKSLEDKVSYLLKVYVEGGTALDPANLGSVNSIVDSMKDNATSFTAQFEEFIRTISDDPSGILEANTIEHLKGISDSIANVNDAFELINELDYALRNMQNIDSTVASGANSGTPPRYTQADLTNLMNIVNNTLSDPATLKTNMATLVATLKAEYDAINPIPPTSGNSFLTDTENYIKAQALKSAKKIQYEYALDMSETVNKMADKAVEIKAAITALKPKVSADMNAVAGAGTNDQPFTDAYKHVLDTMKDIDGFEKDLKNLQAAYAAIIKEGLGMSQTVLEIHVDYKKAYADVQEGVARAAGMPVGEIFNSNGTMKGWDYQDQAFKDALGKWIGGTYTNNVLDTEDLNGDGRLDPWEDADGDGILDTEDANGNGSLDANEDQARFTAGYALQDMEYLNKAHELDAEAIRLTALDAEKSALSVKIAELEKEKSSAQTGLKITIGKLQQLEIEKNTLLAKAAALDAEIARHPDSSLIATRQQLTYEIDRLYSPTNQNAGLIGYYTQEKAAYETEIAALTAKIGEKGDENASPFAGYGTTMPLPTGLWKDYWYLGVVSQEWSDVLYGAAGTEESADPDQQIMVPEYFLYSPTLKQPVAKIKFKYIIDKQAVLGPGMTGRLEYVDQSSFEVEWQNPDIQSITFGVVTSNSDPNWGKVRVTVKHATLGTVVYYFDAKKKSEAETLAEMKDDADLAKVDCEVMGQMRCGTLNIYEMEDLFLTSSEYASLADSVKKHAVTTRNSLINLRNSITKAEARDEQLANSSAEAILRREITRAVANARSAQDLAVA